MENLGRGTCSMRGMLPYLKRDNAEELKREGNFRERGDEEATLPIHFRMVRTGGSSRSVEE